MKVFIDSSERRPHAPVPDFAAIGFEDDEKGYSGPVLSMQDVGHSLRVHEENAELVEWLDMNAPGWVLAEDIRSARHPLRNGDKFKTIFHILFLTKEQATLYKIFWQ